MKRLKDRKKETVVIVPYCPDWQDMFVSEARFFRFHIDKHVRIEHFSSTALQDMWTKPVIAMLDESHDPSETLNPLKPNLRDKDDEYYRWTAANKEAQPSSEMLTRRDQTDWRTHHIHFARIASQPVSKLLFEDYLIEFPDVARKYSDHERVLEQSFSHDRIAYSLMKGDFVR